MRTIQCVESSPSFGQHVRDKFPQNRKTHKTSFLHSGTSAQKPEKLNCNCSRVDVNVCADAPSHDPVSCLEDLLVRRRREVDRLLLGELQASAGGGASAALLGGLRQDALLERRVPVLRDLVGAQQGSRQHAPPLQHTIPSSLRVEHVVKQTEGTGAECTVKWRQVPLPLPCGSLTSGAHLTEGSGRHEELDGGVGRDADHGRERERHAQRLRPPRVLVRPVVAQRLERDEHEDQDSLQRTHTARRK